MAVEAALITPLIMILVFGIIEFSFLVRDYVAVTSAVRSGARIASTGADAGNCDPDSYVDPVPCPANGSPELAQMAANAIQKAGSVMPKDAIEYILVYKANDEGYPGSNGNTTLPQSCSGYANCVRYTWRDAQNKFRYSGGNWDAQTISACFPGSASYPLDKVGVAMVADHDMFTGLFSDSFKLVDRASFTFEPLETASCGANQHP